MSASTTRRGFLRGAAAAGGGLVVGGLCQAAPTAQSDGPRIETRDAANASPILVVTESLSADVNPRAPAWGYIEEILERAGLFFDRRSPSHLPSLAARSPAVVLLAGTCR